MHVRMTGGDGGEAQPTYEVERLLERGTNGGAEVGTEPRRAWTCGKGRNTYLHQR